MRAALRESRDTLFTAIRGLGEEQFRHNPRSQSYDTESTWNIATHLAHLLRIERVFAERGTAALREHERFCASTRVDNDDDPALAQHLAVPQIIHGLQASRRELESLLDHGEDAMERAIIHERIGRMTVRDIVKKMAEHEREHAASIAIAARQASAARRVTIPLTPRS